MKMIMKPYIVNLCGLIFLHFLFSSALKAQPDLKEVPYGDNKEVGKYIPVNGVKIYYEIYGKGAPLVLLHGNGGNIAYMKPQIEYFAKKYKVIIMDCRGRGKVSWGKTALPIGR